MIQTELDKLIGQIPGWYRYTGFISLAIAGILFVGVRFLTEEPLIISANVILNKESDASFIDLRLNTPFPALANYNSLHVDARTCEINCHIDSIKIADSKTSIYISNLKSATPNCLEIGKENKVDLTFRKQLF